MSRMHPNPRPVGALDVTAVAVIIIAVAAPFPVSANGSAHPRPDEPANRGPATSAEGAAEDGPKGSTEYQATKCILSSRFLRRHHQSQTQHRRDSHISKHSSNLHSVKGPLRTHIAQVIGKNRPLASHAGAQLALGNDKKSRIVLAKFDLSGVLLRTSLRGDQPIKDTNNEGMPPDALQWVLARSQTPNESFVFELALLDGSEQLPDLRGLR